MEQDTISTSNIDPLVFEKYFKDIQYPISQDDLMLVVRGNNAPNEVVEQMEEMLRSDSFSSSDQIYNEMGGFYTDGDAQSMDQSDSDNY